VKTKNSLLPPVECANDSDEDALRCPMEQWMDAARNSDDIRDRIAVVTGMSRGAFGQLHLPGNSANDDVID